MQAFDTQARLGETQNSTFNPKVAGSIPARPIAHPEAP